VIFSIGANLQLNQSIKLYTISGPCSTREMGVYRWQIVLKKPPNTDGTSDCIEQV